MTPRLRLFAGPNGSGKSTLKASLHPGLLTPYLNPDDLERELRESGFVDLRPFKIAGLEQTEAREFFRRSPLLRKAGLENAFAQCSASAERLAFADVTANSYLASTVAEFLRTKLLESRSSFTLETVMSHPGKVELLREARQLGYRTYLYFVATDGPRINLARVQGRVRSGGHAVPPDKIVARYYASLELLPAAIRETNRAYIFDKLDRRRGMYVAGRNHRRGPCGAEIRSRSGLVSSCAGREHRA